MSFYDEVLRAERQRTLGCGLDIPDDDEIKCPICGSVDWDFIFKDYHGDTVGCQECVTKSYPEDWQ